MRTYIATTGVLFGAITVAHVWKAAAEGSHVAKDPFFVALTLASIGLTVWAIKLLRAR